MAGDKADDLVDKQLDAFRRQLRPGRLNTAKRKNLTRYDVLIIASMVEREAPSDSERPLISSVIYNRLKEGMKLGIDATIRYAERNWTGPLKPVRARPAPEPYNTRLNHQACRRRRSATPAWPAWKVTAQTRHSSTTSTTWSSRGRAGSTRSPSTRRPSASATLAPRARRGRLTAAS